MADKDSISTLIAKIRERIVERAVNGAPHWSAPVENSARSTAGCLLVGLLLERLPSEDASALCETLLAEQNDDGSWSLTMNEDGDLSLTLEVVEALSEARLPVTREALSKAVEWLQENQDLQRLDVETVLLLRSLTELPKSKTERVLGPLLCWFFTNWKLRASLYRTRPSLAQALKVLSFEKSHAFGRSRELLELQYVDGSWDGSTRSTVMALLALRHTGLGNEDGAFERGWRYLRSLQAWDENALVVNPCDFSNLLHAATVRTLAMTGADAELTTTSVLTLLHQQRASGGWAMGGLLPSDLYTSALALDALSFAGDIPIETSWSRRRAALLLARTQNPDGGWPLYYLTQSRLSKLFRFRGRIGGEKSLTDVTALAVQALAYCGIQDPVIERAIENGVRCLLRCQEINGLWRSDLAGSAVVTTSRVIEALLGALPDRSRAATTNAVRAVMRRQCADGGWGASHHTAAAIRALSGMSGVPADVLRRGRKALTAALDVQDMEWKVDSSVLPLPFGEPLSGASDLVTLWALEALAPSGGGGKPRRTSYRQSRSVYRGRV